MSDRRDPRLEQAYARAEVELDLYYAQRRRRGPPILLGTLLALTTQIAATAFMLVRRPDGEQQVELVLRRNGDGWAVVRTPEVCAAAGCGGGSGGGAVDSYAA